jgi:hypothetical protein
MEIREAVYADLSVLQRLGGMHQVAETAYVTATQTTKLWVMKKDIND